MTGACYATGINPSGIPGENLRPDVVQEAAGAMSRDAQRIRQFGTDVLAEWRTLPGHYEAPEAAQLYAAMDPVSADAETVAAALSAVSSALSAFAEELRPIKAKFAAVRSDAWAFRNTIAGNAEWEYHQGLVDENTALVSRVNAIQVELWDAERRCANAIRAQYGAGGWHAADGSDDGLSYGVDAIPTAAEMAWGSEVQRKDHCPKAAAVQTKRFVWDGVVVDGLWGGVTGLGLLVGIDGWSWSWDTMQTSWVGLGSLIGYADGEWSWGNAGDGWTALGKGVVAWDTWADDPGRAAGGAVFNLATILVPAGAAVSGSKSAATAAGTAGRVGRFLVAADKVLSFTDPVSLGVIGAKTALPRLADLAGGLAENLDVLARGFDLSGALDDLDVVPDLDVPAGQLDDLADVPVRDPDLTGPTDAPDAPAAPVDDSVDELVDDAPGTTHSPDAQAPGAGPPGGPGAGGGDQALADPGSWPFDLTDPEQVYQHAFHNMGSDIAVLGRFESGSPTSYEAVARELGAAYFELGTEGGLDLWDAVSSANGLSSSTDMFDALNAPFLDDVMLDHKTILFSHDPLAAPDHSFLTMEFDYIFGSGPFVGAYRWDPSVGIAGAAVPTRW